MFFTVYKENLPLIFLLVNFFISLDPLPIRIKLRAPCILAIASNLWWWVVVVVWCTCVCGGGGGGGARAGYMQFNIVY